MSFSDPHELRRLLAENVRPMRERELRALARQLGHSDARVSERYYRDLG